MVKIYTKTGDTGETSLYGCRVPKGHPVLEVIGDLDELNAQLGVALAHEGVASLRDELTEVQRDLFALGSEFAIPEGKQVAGLALLGEEDVTKLERLIDAHEVKLTPLKNFILPGGSPLGASLHLARTIARRAERAAVALTEKQPVRPEAMKYLNRLSDYLFVAARTANAQAGAAETIWQGRS